MISPPVTLPEKVCFTVLPPNSCVTENETLSPLTRPSEISISPLRPLMVPVSFSPLALRLKVTSRMLPLRPGTCAVHLPETSAAQMARVNVNIVINDHRIFRVMGWFSFHPYSITRLCILNYAHRSFTLQRMPTSLSARLSLMMFLNYVIWGAWYVTLGTYLTVTLKFTATQAGEVFATAALACMISPFFVGLVADRFFATEKVLATLHLMRGLLLYLVTKVSSFCAVYAVVLAHCLCYFPTISLTNSLTLRHIKDASREFPLIRVFATIGWIVIGQTVGLLGVETTSTPFLLAAGASIVMSAYCLTLPHTPPVDKGTARTVRNVLGLDALVLFKQPAYRVFTVASILACIPLTFYYSFTNAYLNNLVVHNAAGTIALGQISE